VDNKPRIITNELSRPNQVEKPTPMGVPNDNASIAPYATVVIQLQSDCYLQYSALESRDSDVVYDTLDRGDDLNKAGC